MKSFTSLMLLAIGFVAVGCSRPVTPAQRAAMPVVGEAPPQVGSQPKPAALRGDGVVYTDAEEGPSAVVTLATPGATQGSASGPTLQYDPSTEVTFTGPIVGKREVRIAGDEEKTAVVLRMHREGEIMSVYLAPTEWLAGKGIKLSVASTATVTGSQVVVNGQPTLMARTLNVGLGDIDLRDADGIPAWHVPTY